MADDWNALPPPVRAAALRWAERYQVRQTAVPEPPCPACVQLLTALCAVGPAEQQYCDLRADVVAGRRDSEQVIREVMATTDPDLLWSAREWVQHHA